MLFGDTGEVGDFARGISSGGVTIGGIYAFDVGSSNFSLGFQPVGPSLGDMTPGDIILRIQNNTGVDAQSILVNFNIYYYNDQDRSNSIAVSHSFDSYTNYSPLTLEVITPGAPDALPAWQSVSKSLSIDLSSTPLASGNSYYIKWTTNDVSGLGSRDEKL